MCEDEHLIKLEEKINTERERLDILVLEGLKRDDLLDLSCKLDDLINDYYRLVLGNNSSHKI